MSNRWYEMPRLPPASMKARPAAKREAQLIERVAMMHQGIIRTQNACEAMLAIQKDKMELKIRDARERAERSLRRAPSSPVFD